MPTNKEKFNKKYGFSKDEGHSLTEIAKKTGISRGILQQVYNRGVGAWKSNPASVRLKSGQKAPSAPRSAKMGKEQWAQARVYSFVMGGKTRTTADADLWKKHKK
tara:strand:+ start:1375 stop:1689 length:315 start_codon:yes stop_codon:yes gene_type:complete